MFSPYLSLIIATIIWGALTPIGKLAMREITPIQLIAARVVLAGLTLTLLLAIQGKTGAIRDELRQRPGTILVLTLLSFITSSGSSMIALSLLPASVSSLLTNTSPLFVAIGAIVANRGRVAPGMAVGIVIGFIGLGVVVFGENPSGFGSLALDLGGVGLALFGSLCWAGYIGAGRQALAHGNSLAVVAACGLVASGPWVLLAGLTGDLARFPSLSLGAWGLLVFIGVIGTGVAYGLWTAALRQLSASSVAVFQYGIPFCAIALAVLLLGEPITLPLILGGSGIIVGIAITQRSPRVGATVHDSTPLSRSAPNYRT